MINDRFVPRNQSDCDHVSETLASDIATIMAGWNKIESAAKSQFPHADKAELYQICKGAMNHALNPTKQ